MKYFLSLQQNNISNVFCFIILTLSDEDSTPIKEGVSIVSCCMNRNINLCKAIDSWIALPVDEIIVVDWSSDIPVLDSLSHLTDPRVKVIRVENEPNWILTYGFNVGLQFASFSKILKLDADISVSADF